MKKKVRRTSKKFLSILLTLLLTVALLPAVVAHGETTVSFDVLRTAINPGYYFSGILIDMGIPLKAGDVDKDTFAAAAKVTEANGDVQGSFGNFAWDPEKEDYALEDNWAKWNILDAYVADAQGIRPKRATMSSWTLNGVPAPSKTARAMPAGTTSPQHGPLGTP